MGVASTGNEGIRDWDGDGGGWDPSTGSEVKETDVVKDTEFVRIGGIRLIAHAAENDELIIPYLIGQQLLRSGREREGWYSHESALWKYRALGTLSSGKVGILSHLNVSKSNSYKSDTIRRSVTNRPP